MPRRQATLREVPLTGLGFEVVVALVSLLLLALTEIRFQRKVRTILATPDLLTDAERAILATASLDQANHVIMGVRERRRREFGEWLDGHLAEKGPLWQMRAPAGEVTMVEVRQPGEFAGLVSSGEVDWDWDFSATRLAVWPRRRGVRDVPTDAWVFTPLANAS